MARCSGIRADGGRCGAQAIRSSEYCVNHHPDYEEARRRRNSKGGKRGGRGRPGSSEIAEIKGQLAELYTDVLAGRVGTTEGAVATQVAHARLRALESERRVTEADEYLHRIEDLERRMGVYGVS
jgi:hypothetical protein